ncbi:hypothetical protein BC835DRAFT_197313 [Cytidiella melzeri]|nr:hypothetical protein BC835DRAFT_197313 [Cytidiella melzeri]
MTQIKWQCVFTRRHSLPASSVPLLLLSSTIILFVFVMLGYSWHLGLQVPTNQAKLPWGTMEKICTGFAAFIAIAYTCCTLGASFMSEHEDSLASEKEAVCDYST